MERRRQNSRYADIISASSENVVIIRFIGYKVWLKGCLLKRHFRLHSHFQRSANLALLAFTEMKSCRRNTWGRGAPRNL
jgi:hypothetical protein